MNQFIDLEYWFQVRACHLRLWNRCNSHLRDSHPRIRTSLLVVNKPGQYMGGNKKLSFHIVTPGHTHSTPSKSPLEKHRSEDLPNRSVRITISIFQTPYKTNNECFRSIRRRRLQAGRFHLRERNRRKPRTTTNNEFVTLTARKEAENVRRTKDMKGNKK